MKLWANSSTELILLWSFIYFITFVNIILVSIGCIFKIKHNLLCLLGYKFWILGTGIFVHLVRYRLGVSTVSTVSRAMNDYLVHVCLHYLQVFLWVFLLFRDIFTRSQDSMVILLRLIKILMWTKYFFH